MNKAVTIKWIRIFSEAIKSHKRIKKSNRDVMWQAVLDSMQEQRKDLLHQLQEADPIGFRYKAYGDLTND